VLFAVDISDVTYIGHDADSNAQHVARWPAGEEYLRPSLTPTTLGSPKPVRRLLAQTTDAAGCSRSRLSSGARTDQCVRAGHFL
jgi:hypothetical protein